MDILKTGCYNGQKSEPKEGKSLEPARFYAVLSRMKYIGRWGLMRNTRQENLSEHSLEVAVIAHALALVRNVRFGGQVNAERAAVFGMLHDAPEILTGDLPTPVKYYNDEIKTAYRQVEQAAVEQLCALLPEDLKEAYKPLFSPRQEDREIWRLVKAADKLSALIKCLEEKRMGNGEFQQAEEATRRALEEMALPEVTVFMEEMLPAYELTLDQQTQTLGC